MDKPLIRFTLFLPINKNTYSHLNKLLSLIRDDFGGCTFSRFHFPPLELNDNKIKGYFTGKFGDYPDEDVCFIIFDVDVVKFPNVYEDTSKLIKKILDIGEDVVWLTYQEIKLCN